MPQPYLINVDPKDVTYIKSFFTRLGVSVFSITALLFSGYGCSTLNMGPQHSLPMGQQHSLTCYDCHEGNAEVGKPALKYPENPSFICKEKCHIADYVGDHHPASTEPGPFGTTGKIDPIFKLYDNYMECLTCHQIHSGGEYITGAKFLLRGGPYRDRRAICFRCHEKEAYEGVNPHESMLAEGYELNKKTCLICHSSPPDPDVEAAADVKMRSAVSFLCWRCHAPMDSGFFDEHYLKKQKLDTFITMKISKEEHDILYPLDYKKRLTCSTCHNPHQPGVMFDWKASMGAGEKGRLRNKVKCIHCHSTP